MFRVVRRIWGINLLVLMLACQFRTSVRQMHKEFKGQQTQPAIVDINVQGHRLRYVVVNKGPTPKPVVVFVHGAPGSSDNYFQYMRESKLVDNYTLISIDRIGYGYSGFGKSETSIANQAASLLPVLKRYRNHYPLILVGHSYGGPIIAKAAANYPELVDGLILLAPAIDPDHEKEVKVAWLGHHAPFRWLVPRSWRVAADEKITHVSELRKIENIWSGLRIPILYIQGDKDSLVPYDNIHFAEKMISDKYLTTISIPGEDHFIPWSQRPLITQSIIAMITQMMEDKSSDSSGK